MSRTARRIIIGVLVVILVLMVVLAVLIPYSFSRSFPQTEGEIQVEGVGEEAHEPEEVVHQDHGHPVKGPTALLEGLVRSLADRLHFLFHLRHDFGKRLLVHVI